MVSPYRAGLSCKVSIKVFDELTLCHLPPFPSFLAQQNYFLESPSEAWLNL